MGIYNKQILNEVYFGKSKETLALENIIGNIRKDFKKSGTRTNSSPSIQKFNRLMESTFGIKRFALRIDFSMFDINAYTIPLSIKLDNIRVSKKYITTKNSIKFAEGTDFCCIVNLSLGLMLEDEMTNGEVLAIILHEVGHNFSSCLSSKSAMLSGIKKTLISVSIIMGIISAFLTDNQDKKVKMSANSIADSMVMLNAFDKLKLKILENDTVNDTLSLTSMIMGLIDSIKHQLNILKMILKPISYLLTLFFNLIVTLINYLPPIYFINLLGYREEQMADSFANIHGYGPELVSGLSKMTKATSKIELTGIGQLNQLMFMPIILLSMPVEAHPDDITRVKNNLDYLKKELNDCDPRMRKEINEQISDIEKTLDETIKECKEAYMGTNMYACKLYSAFVYDHFGGDPRDILFNNDTYEQIDKHYKDKLGKK